MHAKYFSMGMKVQRWCDTEWEYVVTKGRTSS